MFSIFYVLKIYIFTDIFIINIRLNDIIYQINIPKELSSGLVATGLRLSFKGIVEDVLAHLDLLPTQKISNTLAMMSGENNDGAGPENGPAKGSGSASGSASAVEVGKNEDSDKKGVVTWNDYLWDSNSEADSNPKNNEGDENSENNDPDLINQLIYSGDFEKNIHECSKERIAECLDKLESMKNSYIRDINKIPAAKEQISILERKESVAIQALENKLQEEEDNLTKVEDKGKGKEKEN